MNTEYFLCIIYNISIYEYIYLWVSVCMGCATSISVFVHDTNSKQEANYKQLLEILSIRLVENILMKTVGAKHFVSKMKNLFKEFTNLM